MTAPKTTISTPSDLEVQIAREFSATADLVWKAMTTPVLLKKWMFAPPGWTMTQCDEDLRVGGAFRWAWQDGSGAEVMAMRGTYREVKAPSRIVRTETFEFGCVPQAGEQVATMTFESLPGGKTLVKTTVLFPSKEARDGMLASGMEHGMEAGYQQLDAMLAAGQV